MTDASADADARYFTDLNKTDTDYGYDAMGNMLTDANKHITGIRYNHINLPVEITREGDAQAGKLKYYYSGAGQKLMVEVYDSPTATKVDASKTRTYLSGLVLKGDKVEFIGTPEGRALPRQSIWTNPDGEEIELPTDASTWAYEYHLKDHLGNLRVGCRCGDPKRNANNGKIRTNANNREPVIAVQTADYDPWGLDFGAPTVSPSGVENLDHRYLYNGKEKLTDLGLNLYEYGFRWHDPQLGRFVQVDPLAMDYAYKSTYDYAENKPINGIDLDGLEFLNIQSGELIENSTTQTQLNLMPHYDTHIWNDLISFTPPKDVINKAKARNLSVTLQPLNGAFGNKLNVDYYSVNINKLPSGFNNEDDFFQFARQNLNMFMQGSNSEFSEYSASDLKAWNSDNFLGVTMRFDVYLGPINAEDMSVVSTYVGKNNWVFSPVSTFFDQEHPLAGNRQFGLTTNSNGTYTFFTRGIDKTWGVGDTMLDNVIFNGAVDLWQSVMFNMNQYINQNGGDSSIGSSTHKLVKEK